VRHGDENMKINVYYCPKCGEQSLRQYDPKKFECENCGFTFYKNPAAAVAGIIEYGGKIILTRRGKEPEKGKLDLPGGFVEVNETLEEALLREVKEELGISINDLSYLCSFPNQYPYKGIEYWTIDSIFVCKTGTLNIVCEVEEIERYELLDPKELDPEDLAFISIRNAVRRYVVSLSHEKPVNI
jgi:mutator protein MutT